MRRRIRRKQRVMWTGLNATNVVLTANTTTALTLWDPVLYPEIAVGNVVLQRIVGNIDFIRELTGMGSVGWYFGVFDTDGTDTTPGAIMPAPTTADVDISEKKDLFGFAHHSVPSLADFQNPSSLRIDVKSKRKVGGNKSVQLVIRTPEANVRLISTLRLLVKLG